MAIGNHKILFVIEQSVKKFD